MEISDFSMEDYNTFGKIVNDAVGYLDVEDNDEVRCVTVGEGEELIGVVIACKLVYIYYRLIDGVFKPMVINKDSSENSLNTIVGDKEYTLSLFSDAVAITDIKSGIIKSLSFVDDYDGCIIYQLLDQNNNKRVSLTYSQKKVPSASDIRPYIFSQRIKESDGIVIEDLTKPKDVIAYQKITVEDGLLERLSLNIADSNGISDFVQKIRADYEDGFAAKTRYVRCFPKGNSSFSIHTPFWSVISKREYNEIIKKSGIDKEVDYDLLSFYNGDLSELDDAFLIAQYIDKCVLEEKIGGLVLKIDDEKE